MRVEDDAKRPVAGASVVFTLPTEGATGDFNGEKTLILTTDARGEAAARPFKLNAIPGKVPIHVTVSYRGLTASTVINQVSVVPPGEKAGKNADSGHRGVLIGVLIAIGAAAGGGAAYAASQKSQQSSPAAPPPAGPTPIAITPGTGSIAGGK